MQDKFWSKDIQILLCTYAASEGINLQCCWNLFNYDIPWNPNRLEQRMGLIHRYLQDHPCTFFNLVAIETSDGEPVNKQRELVVLGNGMTSLIESSPVSNITRRSNPRAIPP